MERRKRGRRAGRSGHCAWCIPGRAQPERPRGPEGALGVPTSASAPERDSTQGLLPVSAHKIPFHGTAEPLVCQDAARETLVHVINLLATPFPRGQALEERSGVGSESVTNPKWAEAAERRATPATLSPGVRASERRPPWLGRGPEGSRRVKRFQGNVFNDLVTSGATANPPGPLGPRLSRGDGCS